MDTHEELGAVALSATAYNVASEAAERARTERDDCIRSAARAGVAQHLIAATTGLSREMIRLIVKAGERADVERRGARGAPEAFRTKRPIFEMEADDEPLLRADAVANWYDMLAEQGGHAVTGPLTVDVEPNPTFGQVVTDSEGKPIRDRRGVPMTDPARAWITVSGQAVKG